MLTKTEFTTARLFLQHAHASVLWVATMFFSDGKWRRRPPQRHSRVLRL